MILFESIVDIDATTSTIGYETILKSDTIGQGHMTKDKPELILVHFEESVMTRQAFARHVGLKYTTFASWIQKRRRDRCERPTFGLTEVDSSISLFQAVVDGPSSSSSCDP